ncbi:MULTISPECIES: DUF5985 family protein [Polyangium]|uniref:Uncharacterized protein n=2 Tax=Polyangium TaxID=55 RepID=A0A4U1IUK2_9BACT|nr:MULTISPECIES: DUF5985 family protein [Polyangium]MDI1435506.1 DUF5985 family protein [Polyangium sorediatum]TKC98106.1 hypothetical protein E8A74_42500 [Polyangium fumosum]
MIPAVVYILCTLTSLVAMTLLLRAYAARKVRLLLWSGLCFAGLALNNVLLFVDLIMIPEHDLSTVRQIPAVMGVSFLLYGLVYDLRD